MACEGMVMTLDTRARLGLYEACPRESLGSFTCGAI